jgi:hypothetical protein
VPVSFSVGGEVPSPVPGSRLSSGTGFPLFVLLPTGRALSRVTIFELQDSSGASVPGYLSSPAKPANPLFSRNLGCAFFIPKAFLESGETYTATFKMDWMPEPIRWSFRTWEWTPDVK